MSEDPATPWPPTVGDLLPRAAEAYTVPEKLAWILSEEGHGHEWARVLQIGPDDTQRFWAAIERAVIDVPIIRVTDRGYDGVVCGAGIELAIGVRGTRAITSWHYEHAVDAPRLVTAYPISYA